MRHYVGPLVWRFFIFPRGVVRWLGKLYGRNQWLVYSHESVEVWSGLAMFAAAGAMMLRDFLGLADALVEARKVLDGGEGGASSAAVDATERARVA